MKIPNGYNVVPDRAYMEAGLSEAGVTGSVFYVDTNAGIDTNDGKSWQYAFKTLTVALAASHADIAADASGWANRNIIFYKGDNAEADAEDIVALADKTDVVGVGSYDHRGKPFLIGNHTVVGAYMDTRFINMGFLTPAAGGVGVTIPTTCSGIQFLGCTWDGRSTIAGTIGLLATGVEQLKVSECEFIGPFSIIAIDIGAGAGRAMKIVDNYIESGAIGIRVSSTYTCADSIGMILNNTIVAVTLLIDENSDKVVVGGNRGKTQATGQLATTLDCNLLMAYDNIFAHAGGVSQYPVLVAIPAA